MTRLRSAINLHHRPTAALLYKPNPQGKWTRIDYLLVDAFYTMDREICPMCKNPIWLCHSTDNRIDFVIKTQTCYAQAEKEDYEKTSKGKVLGSGEYIIAVPAGIEDGAGGREPLPSRKEAYERMPTDKD